MTSFEDTSDWIRKDGVTLVYPIERNGNPGEGRSQKCPQGVIVEVEKLSAKSINSWVLSDEGEEYQKSDYRTQYTLRANGSLDGCMIHAITLDKSENRICRRIDIQIFPSEVDRLRATSTASEWATLHDLQDRPDDGILASEIGRLYYDVSREYYGLEALFAHVFLSQEKFDDLFEAVKGGQVSSVRLKFVADLFHFEYEGLGAGIRGHYYNYAILCVDEGETTFGNRKSTNGVTAARLQEVVVEWAPKFERVTIEHHGQDIGDENLAAAELGAVNRDFKSELIRLSRDVHGIRSRVETFYQVTLIVLAVIVIIQVGDWVGL